MQQYKDIPSKDDVREVLAICEPLEKSILLVDAASCSGFNEIINLKVSGLKKVTTHKQVSSPFNLRRQKTDYDFITSVI